MIKRHESCFYLPIFVLFLLPFSIAQLSPSEARILFQIRRLLEFPPALSSWNKWTNFCYLPPSPSLSIVCSENQITELTVVGENRTSSPLGSKKDWHTALSKKFSIDSLFTTLSRLSNLTVISLVSLGIWGQLPTKISRFDSLQVLNISSNFIYGEIPPEIIRLENLQSLVLADNLFNGSVPDLRSLSVLKELDLGYNLLGPKFPSFGNNVVSLVLRNNTFRSNIPSELQNFDQMERLDISFNNFVGPIPAPLFSLPAIQYLDLAGNKLSGTLPVNISCSSKLGFVDLSHNHLIGTLPLCVSSNSSNRVVLYSWNCLISGNSAYQHPHSFCQEEALAADMPPIQKNASKSMFGLILGISGGVVGGVLVLGVLMLVIYMRAGGKNGGSSAFQKSVVEKVPVQVAPRLLIDARHMSQAMRFGALGLPPYHVFTLEELEDATNNFDPSNLIGEGSQGQLHKGWLTDSSAVVVRSLKLKQRLTAQSLKKHMEVISKLRHRHLVSILGHCIVNSQDHPNETTTIFLVLEDVSNGNLRSHLTEWRQREMLKWPQRIATTIGVARGIQFLHTGIVPGIFGNDIKIENILLDENLTAKISSYNLPIPSQNKNTKVGAENPFNGLEKLDGSAKHDDKEDIYQLGVILLEVITGKQITSQNELNDLKLQLQSSLMDSPTKLREATDPSIRGTFCYESLRTAVEIMINCLSEDLRQRPSIEDVLWNLQYSVQVQEGWASSENLSTHS